MKWIPPKRNYLTEDDIALITQNFGDFADASGVDPTTQQSLSKNFNTHEFGYRRITIERPLRESYQFSDECTAELRFAPKPLNGVMKWAYGEYGQVWTENADCELYGDLSEHEETIRRQIKNHFSELKEKQIKDLLDRRTWQTQLRILVKAKRLQQAIGTRQYDDVNGYDDAIKATGIKLDAKEKKQITAAVSWKNPEAEKVIKKIHRNSKANPVYGLFEADGRVVEYKADGDLRDFENVALDPSKPVNTVNQTYFAKEVQPHVPEAWIDAGMKDDKDREIGIVGYEIPFNRHFYVYQPPRDLAEIDADLDKVSAEIMELLQEVHS